MAPQKSARLRFQNSDFSCLQNIAKLCFLRNPNWVTAIFFFKKSKSRQNDNRFLLKYQLYPFPCISPPLFSQLVYTPSCISATLFSQSPWALYSLFLLLLWLESSFFISFAMYQFFVPLLLNLCYRFGLFAWWVTLC